MAMLYVEKDLSGVVKAVFDQWDSKKNELNHKVLYCADARVSAGDIIECIERGIPPVFQIRVLTLRDMRSHGQEMYLGIVAYNRCS